jgi:hypothetical protein
MEAPGRPHRSFPLKSSPGFIIFHFPFSLISHASTRTAQARRLVLVCILPLKVCSLVTDIHTTRTHGRYVTVGGDEDSQACVNIPCDCEL